VNRRSAGVQNALRRENLGKSRRHALFTATYLQLYHVDSERKKEKEKWGLVQTVEFLDSGGGGNFANK
jgi:hypothetical protein